MRLFIISILLLQTAFSVYMPPIFNLHKFIINNNFNKLKLFNISNYDDEHMKKFILLS